MISPEGTCAACQGEVGSASSSSCFTFAPTLFPPLPPHRAPPLVLSELLQENPTSDSTSPLGSAWQGLEAPRIPSCVTVPSLLLNKRDIPFAPPGWKLSFLPRELHSVTPRSQEALGIKSPTNSIGFTKWMSLQQG